MRLDGPQKITTKTQPRLQIREGMSVEDVKKYGSDGQKLAASLFDLSADGKKDANGEYLLKDGIFNKQEAALFNQYNFSVKKGSFTMYDRESGHITEFKYNNINDLKTVLNADLNQLNQYIKFDENGISKLYVSILGAIDGKTTIDLTKKTVEFNGLKAGLLYTNGNKTTVKNSNLELISSSSKEVDIRNVKLKGLFGDEKTWVSIDKDTNIKVDNDSKVDIKREE